MDTQSYLLAASRSVFEGCKETVLMYVRQQMLVCSKVSKLVPVLALHICQLAQRLQRAAQQIFLQRQTWSSSGNETRFNRRHSGGSPTVLHQSSKHVRQDDHWRCLVVVVELLVVHGGSRSVSYNLFLQV